MNLDWNMYYNRETVPITQEEWGSLHQNRAYCVVEQTTLPNGLWVSTVWLGLDHSFAPGEPPLVFETMVFPSGKNLRELDQDRYTFEDEAHAGHKAMCEKWVKTSESEVRSFQDGTVQP